MTSPQRLFIDQLVAWLKDEVEDTDDWEIIREEPRNISGQQTLAVWWVGDAVFTDDSTTGWLGLVDTYALTYTEPADEGTRVTEDEDAGDLLSEKLQQVRRCILLHRGLVSAANLAGAFVMEYAGSRKLGATDDAPGVRGFAVEIRVRRPESYT